MDKKQFELSLQLFKMLAETKLGSGRSLREELCLGQHISLWDVISTFLVLYRFPLLFSSERGKAALQKRLSYYLRPYRGLAARFRDAVISPPCRNKSACTKWPEGNPTVLFLGFMPTFYRDVLRSVAELLAMKKHAQVVVIGHSQNPQMDVIADDRLRFQSLWEHWDDDTENLTQVMLKRLQTFQHTLLNRTQFKALIQNAVDHFGCFALHREFYWFFWREFKRLIPQIAVAEHILSQHRPVLIVSADDADQRCRIYSLLAKAMGIPTLLVQQGLSSREYPEWVFFSHSMVAAMGESSRADMIAQGLSPEKIVVTGHPGFDNLVLSEPDMCAHLRTDLGLTDGQKMVLFASQPYCVGVFNNPDIRRIMIKAIINAVSDLKNIKLVVKPHPGDHVRELKRLIGKAPQVVIVDRTMDTSPLIKACDVLVTFFSTVALQALYAGKPVINVDFPNSGGASLYSDSGATWIARSPDQITTHIRNLTSEGGNEAITSREAALQRFLYEMVYIPDGQATERVLQVVLNMLRLGRNSK